MARAYSLDLHERVREKIEAAGARLLYLSPYRPDFNPSEMAWSKLKAHLRKVAAPTSTTLDQAVAEGWRAVSADDPAATSDTAATARA